MAKRTIVVLGAGWGGLAAAHHLRRLLPADHVKVFDRRPTFSFCPSYLWLMTGERRLGDVQRPMALLADPGTEWVHEEVTSLDPGGLTVTTPSGTLHADAIIVALGNDTVPEEVPGFAESAHDLYEAQGAASLWTELSRFRGGEVAVLVTRVPFRCPAAPYEAAMLIDWLLRQRGIRDRAGITVYTPEKQPMPVAGPAVGEALCTLLSERGIRYQPGRILSKIDGATRTLVFADGEASYDLLAAVPPHRVAKVVREAGLVDATGYVPVHPQTLELLSDPDALETRHPGVHAIGDVASIRLLNGLLLPKAGVFAESQARVVAENVAAGLDNRRRSARFDGRGFCYIETGDGAAAYGAGDFFAYPGPRVTLEPPSTEHRRAKLEFETVLQRWFSAGVPNLPTGC